MTEITQADRDIAADYSKRFPEIRLNEAFAAHRIQSTAHLQAHLDMAVAALESAHEQLSLLAKDPTNNPWVKECGDALIAIKGGR